MSSVLAAVTALGNLCSSDAAHTGTYRDEAAAIPRVKGSPNRDDRLLAVIPLRGIYVGGRRKLYAVNAPMAVTWKPRPGARSLSTPAIAGNSVRRQL